VTVFSYSLGAEAGTPGLGALATTMRLGSVGTLALDLIGTAERYSDVGATIPAGIGDSVAAWRSLIAPAATATQDLTIRMPLATAAGLAFGGVNDFMLGDLALRSIEAGQSAVTVYVAARADNLATEATPINWSSSSTADAITGRKTRIAVRADGSVQIVARRVLTDPVTTITSAPGLITVGVPCVIAAVIIYARARVEMYVNGVRHARGVLASAGTSDALPSAETRIGQGHGGDSNFWIGDLRRVQAWHGAHDAAIVAATSAAL
jgi:hypothetical protein